MLEHGGNLRQAAQRYGIPLTKWLDLSTGINPNGWPVPALPAASWRELPQEDDGLEEAARHYYGAQDILAVAGSQAAIQTLPLLRAQSTVGMLAPAYAEHAYHWAKHGHKVRHFSPGELGSHLDGLDVVVLVNPNNPTGQTWPVPQLLDWHRRLAARGGWLVVDEAFIDSTPQQSLAQYADRTGLIVLRSLGKFFGLAGVRCGFVLAAADLLGHLREWLGPWTVSGPAREVSRRALLDRHWQTANRRLLMEQGERLKRLLSCYSLEPDGGTSLFQWLQHPAARQIHQGLAAQGIWTRYFAEPVSLRFGLPANDSQWQTLQQALQQLMNNLRQRDEMYETVVL